MAPRRGNYLLQKYACCPWRRSTWIKLAILLVVVAVVAGLLIGFNEEITHFLGTEGPLAAFVQENLVAGFFLYSLVYVIATVALLPASVLTVVAGFVFPLGWAFLLVSLSSTLGATLSFLLGRTAARAWVRQKITGYPVFVAIDRAVAARGLYLTFLLRLSPLIPFNVLNYALGITPMRLWAYVLASWIGMMPGTLLYVYIGFGAREAVVATGGSGSAPSAEDPSTAAGRTALLIVGALATIAAVVLGAFAARKELKKIMAREQGVDLDNIDDRETLLSDE